MKMLLFIIILGVVGIGGLWFFLQSGSGDDIRADRPLTPSPTSQNESDEAVSPREESTSGRAITVTSGVTHSIPLHEILSGGPGKDGIPSIDAPRFVAAKDANYLADTDPGVGVTIGDESRFYPYRILVWHEIVNDTIAGEPVLVTYCPLCATGIVFERRVGAKEQEFGVSGQLWQSNLLMYNRALREEDESLWSQVLGEAVVGPNTGEKLTILPSEITRFGDWKAAHPDTRVLSQNTGAVRSYGRDPYGDYYTSESVSFGASFNDTRLHPKALVHGIEIDGQYKAYDDGVITPDGIQDAFAGSAIGAERLSGGGVRFTKDGKVIPHVTGFWFSWLAVHPETELYE